MLKFSNKKEWKKSGRERAIQSWKCYSIKLLLEARKNAQMVGTLNCRKIGFLMSMRTLAYVKK